MEQTVLLWEYQQTDHAVDVFCAQIKNNPQRLALQQKLNYLKQQQATIKNMEQAIQDMSAQIEQIVQEYQLLEEKFEKMDQKTQDVPPQTKQEAADYCTKVSKIEKELSAGEKQLQRIIRETAAQEKLHREIRTGYTKIKTEYDNDKVAYDALYREQMDQLHEKQEALARQAEGISDELMQKYQALKKHIALPVAKLQGGQCGGCMMNLPQASLAKFKSDALYIECENCGRMIIQ